jgi:hypothetical protein
MTLSYQSETYQGFDRGSYRFSKGQRDSWRLVVDIEIVSAISPGYRNNKYPLSKEFFGYCQLFYGTSQRLDIPVNYPRQRLIDSINWSTFSSQIDRRRYLWMNQMFQVMSDATIEVEGLFPEIPQAFEIFSLPETVLKFQSEFECAFKFIVTWLPLDLLAEYGETQDSDDSDPSDGEDEYPDVDRRSPGDPLPPGYTVDPSDPDNDPRDYGEGAVSRPAIPGDSGLFEWSFYYTDSSSSDAEHRTINGTYEGVYMGHSTPQNGTLNPQLVVDNGEQSVIVFEFENTMYLGYFNDVVFTYKGGA